MWRIGWKKGVLWTVMGAAVGVLLAVSALFYRPLRADWVLDSEIVAVAMDWRDFGREKALERLEWTLQRRGLNRSLEMEDCGLEENASGVREVKCLWSAEVHLPFTGVFVPLEFSSIAIVDLKGEINGKAL